MINLINSIGGGGSNPLVPTIMAEGEMKKIWIHKTSSFKKANEFEKKYYLFESPEERLSDLQFCREQYLKMKGITDEGRKGLRRVIKVIKQT